MSKMRNKTVAALVLAVALVTLMGGPGYGQGKHDAKGPPCSDIVDNPLFGFAGNRDRVELEVTMADIRCSNVNYTAVLWTEDGRAIPASSATWSTDDPTSITFTWAFDASYWFDRMCAEASTSFGGGGHVADYSPDRTADGQPNTGEHGQCMDQLTAPPATNYG